MLVCHCQRVSDRVVRRAVRRGAMTSRDVARSCGAGARCGGCKVLVRQIIEAECAHCASGRPSGPGR
ncbi:MAG: (2Fe-2S)-binding protein [Proteobacteria bacterium]|nr:(2Fe-2S)-binding protein [Pseudomonadota bacterium]